MTEKIEPMTAAEYQNEVVGNCNCAGCQKGKRVLAAIEDREANLAHARLGSLVAAIREHVALPLFPHLLVALGIGENRYDLDAQDLGFALSHLDSLLPKEPEVVVGPSGFTYGPNKDWDGALFQWKNGKSWCGPIQSAYDDHIPPADAPVVAALLAGGGK